MPDSKKITVEMLREMVHYEPLSGIFTFKKKISQRKLKGMDAVSYINCDGYKTVLVNKQQILAQRVAYALMTGNFPVGMLKFKDNNKENIKWDNLYLMDAVVGDFDHSTPEGRKIYNKAHRDQYPEKNKNVMLKCTFGIDLIEYKKMFQEQNGKCAICDCAETAFMNGKPLALAVDHDHDKGFVRGLLCRACNVAIGNLKEKEKNFLNAIKYLQKHKQAQKTNNVIHLTKGKK